MTAMNFFIEYVITDQQNKNVMLKLLEFSIKLIINSKPPQTGSSMEYTNGNIFSNLEQHQEHYFDQENLIEAPRDQFNYGGIFDFPKEDPQADLKDVFSNSFLPKVSTQSVSTRSNRSYDTFDMEELDFIDEFLSDKPLFMPLEEEIQGLSAPKAEIPLEAEAEGKKDYRNQLEIIEEVHQPQDNYNCHDQTKNIPKNYIKAIFTFILENSDFIQKLFEKANLGSSNVARFIEYIKTEKKTKKYTIERLKSLWLNPQNGKAMRIISCHFLKKRSLPYILGSKIEKKGHHIKHRYKFIKAIENPHEFTNIK